MALFRKLPQRIAIALVMALLILGGSAVAFDIRSTETQIFAIVAAFMVAWAMYVHSQHHRALEGRRLRWLRSLGFTIERIGRYRGYKGVYQGYFTRIYVDPDSLFFRRYGPDLCILVYFQPMRRPDGKLNTALLRRIEADLLNEVRWFESEILQCGETHMYQQTRFTLLTGQARVRKRLERVVSTVAKYGLKPWPEAEVARRVQASPWLHGPSIDEFQENFPYP